MDIKGEQKILTECQSALEDTRGKRLLSTINKPSAVMMTCPLHVDAVLQYSECSMVNVEHKAYAELNIRECAS